MRTIQSLTACRFVLCSWPLSISISRVLPGRSIDSDSSTPPARRWRAPPPDLCIRRQLWCCGKALEKSELADRGRLRRGQLAPLCCEPLARCRYRIGCSCPLPLYHDSAALPSPSGCSLPRLFFLLPNPPQSTKPTPHDNIAIPPPISVRLRRGRRRQVLSGRLSEDFRECGLLSRPPQFPLNHSSARIARRGRTPTRPCPAITEQPPGIHIPLLHPPYSPAFYTYSEARSIFLYL